MNLLQFFNYFNTLNAFRAKDHTMAGCTYELLSNLGLCDLLLGDRCEVKVNKSRTLVSLRILGFSENNSMHLDFLGRKRRSLMLQTIMHSSCGRRWDGLHHQFGRSGSLLTSRPSGRISKPAVATETAVDDWMRRVRHAAQ